ncbi:MAG: YggS family pyridoxal phosphate-dependent enzyme [Bacteroidetes bacterium]|nr:YggS family pyridoxal phosphate-dependent enzyme [Bacteroidota bacterium]
MHIKDNLEALYREIPPCVKIVAVSKTHPVERIREAYEAGQRLFGENKVQEMTAKQPLLPDDISWHFIGHLQSNKVKYIAPFVSMIQSVDSLKLLAEIDKEAKRNNRVIDCLLEMFIASEETKFGLDPDEARAILSSPAFSTFKNIRIAGVMGMATFTPDERRVRKEFRLLTHCFYALQSEFFSHDKCFHEISMGMSGDYKIALEEGSTIVRIGTAIFGGK